MFLAILQKWDYYVDNPTWVIGVRLGGVRTIRFGIIIPRKEYPCQQKYDTDMGVPKNGLRRKEKTMANIILAILTALMAAGAIVRVM